MKTMQHSRQALDKPSGLAFTFPGKQSFLSFLRKVFLFLLFSFFVSPSFSNNIRITGTVKVSESSSHSDTLLLSFSLRWDHSWRDEFNWDAAWVFLKYKIASGAWQPVYLSPGGHRFTDASGSALSFGSMEGETDGKTVGVFIYRTTLESGNTPEIRCHLLCPRSSLGGLPAEAFQRNEAFVLAQGIEMVYIPYGAYYAGDSSSFHTIADAGGHPILVDSEESVSVSTGGSSYTLSSSYPKGYKGFYVMKYEVSQEQYVTFLNNLTYTQQQERVPGLASFSKGDYIFGDASQPSCRNGIIVAVPSEGGRAVIFANNLNNDAKYSQSDDGKTLACNYLSPEDMIAYLSWSGLRPMSELEYEKACRAPYPEMPLEKEYAWHENSGVNVLGAVVSSGERTEKSGTAGANVNAGNRFEGPVRCGLFATGSSSQRDAGASFWGVMEMSGNLRELCYNVSAANAFSGDVYGDGTYNKSRWSTVVSHFGVRGGGFSSEDSLLRVSDRSEAESYFASLTQRDSTVGFRGVRRIGSWDVIQDNLRAIVGEDTNSYYSCPGLPTLLTASPSVVAQVNFPDVEITYMWYLSIQGGKETILPGEAGETLNFDRFVNTNTGNYASGKITYTFRRKAICPVGESSTETINLTVPNPTITLLPSLVYLNNGNAVSSVAVGTAKMSGGTFSWVYQGQAITDANKMSVSSNNPNEYYASRIHFGDKTLVSGEKEVICRYNIGGCISELPLRVVVERYVADPCYGITAVSDADGNSYGVVKIGDQCWLDRDLNVGTQINISSSDSWLFNKKGIQKWCNGNTYYVSDYNWADGDCSYFGGLYEWWETVCNGYCESAEIQADPFLAIPKGQHSSWEAAIAERAGLPLVKNRYLQGICPDGWHLPTYLEWKELESFLGPANAGYYIKATSGYYKGGNGNNASGFNGLAGRCRSYGVGFYYTAAGGAWWSSSMDDSGVLPYSASTWWSDNTLGIGGGNRGHGYSVRCIKN